MDLAKVCHGEEEKVSAKTIPTHKICDLINFGFLIGSLVEKESIHDK